MATQSALALDLTALVSERPLVRINHVDYELRTANDFSALELHRLDRLLPRVQELAGALEDQEATETQCEELSALLTSLCQLVFVELPAEELAKLGDINKLLVFKLFLELLPPSLQRARAVAVSRLTEARPSASASSSRASSASTGATRKRGGRGSRSA